jgi:chromosomal replication initiation ATPase DnaA
MCYQHEVRKRRIPFQEDKETLEKIEKAAKWLTGDYKVGLLLYGIVGSGKSTLGKAICNLIGILHNSSISSERKGVFRVSALDLAKNVANDPMYFIKLKNQELLFIDDIGSLATFFAKSKAETRNTPFRSLDMELLCRIPIRLQIALPKVDLPDPTIPYSSNPTL